MQNIFQLQDLTKTRKNIVIASLLACICPFIFIYLYLILTDIEGSNSFSVLLILIFGSPVAAFGALVYFIADRNSKRKLIFTGILAILLISFLPIMWLIKEIKVDVFLSNNQAELETVANNIINKQWTEDEVKQYILSKNLPIKSTTGKNEKTILFLIGGILDNCNGIAYSQTGNEPTHNPCGGKLVEWEKIKDNWYKWATI